MSRRPRALAPRRPEDLAKRLRSPVVAPERDVVAYVGPAISEGLTQWRLECGHIGLSFVGSSPKTMPCPECGGGV